MGLDTSHDAWHGAYSSFNSFRTDVAKQIGMDLGNMVGFGGERSWDDFEKHPLYELLNHSDCDGEIEVKYLQGIRDSLIEIAPKLNEYHETKAIQFAEGCLLAISENKPIEFM